MYLSKEQPKKKQNNLLSSDNPLLHAKYDPTKYIERGENVTARAVDDNEPMNKPKYNQYGSENKSNISMVYQSLLKSMKGLSLNLNPKADVKPDSFPSKLVLSDQSMAACSLAKSGDSFQTKLKKGAHQEKYLRQFECADDVDPEAEDQCSNNSESDCSDVVVNINVQNGPGEPSQEESKPEDADSSAQVESPVALSEDDIKEEPKQV